MTFEKNDASPQAAEGKQQRAPYAPLRDAQGRLLPGQASINPKGRKPHSHRVRSLARAYTQEAVEVLAEAMRNAPTADARIKAATALLDRGWGKPAQQLSAEINDTKVVTINLGWLSGRSVGGCVIEHDGGMSQARSG
jgi:hypothetical protein